jgi:hypothetical protein
LPSVSTTSMSSRLVPCGLRVIGIRQQHSVSHGKMSFRQSQYCYCASTSGHLPPLAQRLPLAAAGQEYCVHGYNHSLCHGRATDHDPHSSSAAGGCPPVANNTRRRFTTPGLFICKAPTVARPVGVTPTIRVKSSFHLKWSCHLWLLGLYSGTRAPVTESGATILVYL